MGTRSAAPTAGRGCASPSSARKRVSSRPPGPCSYAPRKRHACNADFGRRDSYRQALEIWSADVEPDARLRVLQEMARCAVNCREHSIARLAWEETLEIAPDAGRLVEAHRQLAELDLHSKRFDGGPGRHLELAAELAEKALAASEAAGCWLAYADYLANRLLVRKAREAVATACRFAEKSENPARFPKRSATRDWSPPCAAGLPKWPSWSNALCGSPLIKDFPSTPRWLTVAEPTCASTARTMPAGEAAAHLEAIRYCRTAGRKAASSA